MAKKKVALVEDDKAIVRDIETTAILATDRESLSRHRAHRRAVRQKEEEMNQLRDQVTKLTELVHTLLADRGINIPNDEGDNT